jgi:hypothetical protein
VPCPDFFSFLENAGRFLCIEAVSEDRTCCGAGLKIGTKMLGTYQHDTKKNHIGKKAERGILTATERTGASFRYRENPVY